MPCKAVQRRRHRFQAAGKHTVAAVGSQLAAALSWADEMCPPRETSAPGSGARTSFRSYTDQLECVRANATLAVPGFYSHLRVKGRVSAPKTCRPSSSGIRAQPRLPSPAAHRTNSQPGLRVPDRGSHHFTVSPHFILMTGTSLLSFHAWGN